MDKELKIKLLRSPIGKTKNQKLTLKALGLRRINQIVIQKKNNAILGMVEKVKHLVTIVE